MFAPPLSPCIVGSSGARELCKRSSRLARPPDQEPAAITQDLGTAWQREGHSVALAVPSVLIPEETCVLLNPGHADTDQVAVSWPVAFEFDERI